MVNGQMDDQTAARACELFSALSNPVRLRIVESLCRKDSTVGAIAAEMGIGHSGASQHLAILARAGVAASESVGTSRVYRVRGPRIGAILTLIEEFCHVHGLYGAPADEPGGTD
ncbi:ArsR family transcriptional regulator [bacterium]|nr:MAG: ArsR family transcriptional regulator [bacterium]